MNPPRGFIEREDATVYMSNQEIVIVGMPDEDDENHNCDHMGCSSVQHVIFRSPLPNNTPFYDKG